LVRWEAIRENVEWARLAKLPPPERSLSRLPRPFLCRPKQGTITTVTITVIITTGGLPTIIAGVAIRRGLPVLSRAELVALSLAKASLATDYSELQPEQSVAPLLAGRLTAALRRGVAAIS
jgi:hypothetical protein